jgi:hypothetical protein
MLHGACPGHTFGKICYFALIGFLALLLAGPALGLLSVLLSIVLAIFSVALAAFVVILPFAILGFLIVARIKALSTGRPVDWRRLGSMCGSLWRGILGVAWWCWRKLVGFIQFLRKKAVALAVYIRAGYWEVLCGAGVGGFLGAAVAWNDLDKPEIFIGAALGAILGALVGISRADIKRPALTSPAEPAP